MNYGQSQAVMVLVGERLGFKMANAVLAKQVLNGANVHPMRYVDLEREATELNNRIRKRSGAVAEANALSKQVMAEYGLN